MPSGRIDLDVGAIVEKQTANKNGVQLMERSIKINGP